MGTIKNKVNQTLRFFSSQKLITSIVLCVVFALLYFAIKGFYITSGNDDRCVSEVIYGGNTAIPCMGYFYTAFCVLVQPLFSKLSVYICLQEIICFVSLAAVNCFFIAKSGLKEVRFTV